MKPICNIIVEEIQNSHLKHHTKKNEIHFKTLFFSLYENSAVKHRTIERNLQVCIYGCIYTGMHNCECMTPKLKLQEQ